VGHPHYVQGKTVKLIVGLGNPGMEYQFTPHNLGFLAVDRIAEKYGMRVSNRNCKALTGRGRIGEVEVVLAKPETYMNLSGSSVRELVAELEIDPQKDMIVIYDDLDLPYGSIRVRERGSAGGHNGVQSIISALGTQEFLRIRIGIAPEFKLNDGASYVLSQLKKSQLPVVDQALDEAAEAVKIILGEGPAPAMNRFNRKPEKADEPGTAK
jgi:PTH1 family peptidyl-tRNA hydrolase